MSFNMEIGNTKRLSFLDLLVRRMTNGTLQTSLYGKSAHTGPDAKLPQQPSQNSQNVLHANTVQQRNRNTLQHRGTEKTWRIPIFSSCFNEIGYPRNFIGKTVNGMKKEKNK